MLRPLISLVFALLLWPGIAPAADDAMLYVEYKLVSSQIAADSFDAQTKKVWRLGSKFLRFEDAPNPQSGIHGLIIVAEPDIWIIDRNTQKGRHSVDPGPSYKIHFPLFASETSEKLRALEFGSELEFFQENGATVLPHQVIDGIRCKVMRLELDDRTLTLMLRSNDIPFQIGIKTPEYEYAMRFLRYDPDVKPDKSLFQLPAGVQIGN